MVCGRCEGPIPILPSLLRYMLRFVLSFQNITGFSFFPDLSVS